MSPNIKDILQAIMTQAPVSEEVPLQAGYSDEYGTYDEYGTMVDYYRGLTPTLNVAEPTDWNYLKYSAMRGAHSAIDAIIAKNDAAKGGGSLYEYLLGLLTGTPASTDTVLTPTARGVGHPQWLEQGGRLMDNPPKP